jgi:ribonuclease R
LAKLLAERVTAPKSAQATRSRVAQAQMQGWEAAGLHCSANERRADEASRDVEAWLKCKYMRDYLGEEFSGTVSAVTSFGLFVTLETMYVEGLVHISELGGDYYRFDEMRQELRGERTGVRYAIGTRMQVQVSRVDLDARRIDFCLVQEESKEGKEGKDLAAAPPPPQRGPGRSRAARRTAALLQQQEQEEMVGAFIPDARFDDALAFGKVGKAEQRIPSGAKTASTHKASGAQAVKASKASKSKSPSRASGAAKAGKNAAGSKKIK